jgi:hypothetical protein
MTILGGFQIPKRVSLSYAKNHCNNNTYNVFSVFSNRCLVAASNDGRRPASSGFPNCPRPQLPASHFLQLQLSTDRITTEVTVMLRPTVSRTVCHGAKLSCGAKKNRFLLMSDMWGFVYIVSPLWREDGSVYNLCFSWPVKSFPGPSPVRFTMTTFWCLRIKIQDP